MKTLTQKRLKEVLNYDPETGIFTWKVASKGTSKGAIAGCPDGRGYVVIGVDRMNNKAHRLAWLYIHGYFPENDIDHIDRIRNHNWILNLREASPQCNLRNTGNFKHNKSGVKGVHFNRGKWVANVRINNKTKYIGRYKKFINAVCARLATEQCLNWSGCDSNSPAYKYVKEIIKGALI